LGQFAALLTLRLTLKKGGKGRTGRKAKASKLTFHKLDGLEKITLGIGLWFLIYPRPYQLLLGILLIIPVFGILYNGLKRPSIASLVRISTNTNGKENYDVADFIDIAAWVILVRVVLDFEFESYYSMILPGTISFLVVSLIVLISHRLIESNVQNKWWIYSSLTFSVIIYCYAGIYAANCAFDNSEPKTYRTEVLDKRMRSRSRGRKTYYLKVAPWGHHLDTEDLRVSSSLFHKVEIGNEVNIKYKNGLFRIPWYYVKRTDGYRESSVLSIALSW